MDIYNHILMYYQTDIYSILNYYSNTETFDMNNFPTIYCYYYGIDIL